MIEPLRVSPYFYEKEVYRHPVKSAVEQVKNMIEEEQVVSLPFCPAINNRCNVHCINYHHAEFIVSKKMSPYSITGQHSPDYYRLIIKNPWCSNSMINNERCGS